MTTEELTIEQVAGGVVQRRPTRSTARIMREISALEGVLWRSLNETTKGYLALISIFAALTVFGLVGYAYQLKEGLSVTGLSDRISWGFYISHFVFLIGMSYGGTLISAVLRLTGAEWRRPITRLAETVSVATLMMGGIMPIVDLGRPDRALSLFFRGRLTSPIVWDVLAVNTYLVACLIYLYLPLIPDLAALRDRFAQTAGFAARIKHRIYSLTALRWRGTDVQKKYLNRGIGVMAIMIIPLAISVHTVLAWILGMTLRTGWNSTIFGPYFVVGAVLSGIATILIFMAIYRKLYGLEDYITEKQFRYLGLLMMVFAVLYAYFVMAEYLTVGYKMEPSDKMLLKEVLTGAYAPHFWVFAITGLILPVLIVANPKTRNVKGIVIAAILVNIAMWEKRAIIVVPTMALPQLPTAWAVYKPTWVEWSIVFGTIGGAGLIFSVMAKLFPLISVWEVEEGLEHDPDQLAKSRLHRNGRRRGTRVPARPSAAQGAIVPDEGTTA